MKIINNQLGQFTKELDIVLKKNLNKIAASLDVIPPEVWKTRKFNDLLLRYCYTINNQNKIDRWTKGHIFAFPMKNDLRIAKNYQAITLTSIVAKIYNALLLNHIKPEIEKILRKNQNCFQKNWSTKSQILTIRWILEVCAKSLKQHSYL